MDVMEIQLILEAKSGNREAFGQLVGLYGKRVYHTAFSFLHNVDDAADIVQEVFLRAYKNLTSFDVTKALFPWLYRITKNLCINAAKRSSRREGTLPVDDLLPSRSFDPVRDLTRGEEAEELRKAIASLEENHRNILIMKHFQDCSYADMSEILEIPIGTVMSRLYNARMRLREKLIKEL